MTHDTLCAEMLEAEANRAEARWGPFRSPHEAYGVLAEEVMEMLQAIHANNYADARQESMQVAAVAYRFGGGK